jgi:hypothetical protein
MGRWRSRSIAFAFGFTSSLLAVFIYSLVAGLFTFAPHGTRSPANIVQGPCLAEAYFASPEAILAALKSEDVGVRREVFRRLFLRPGATTIYYDYERDREYPARAAGARVRYVNLDGDAEPEALLTFVRFAQPVVLVLKRDACGWQLCAALSAWLRFEDYPYQDWFELPELFAAGTHELLLHESTGDASTYVRKVRVLKLFNGTLTQIAEFNEEETRPVADYHGADWSDVRQRETTRYTIMPVWPGEAPWLRLETTRELIKYVGDAPIYTYWLETDGAWHALTRHWHTRPAVRLKLLDADTHNLIWVARRDYFVGIDE